MREFKPVKNERLLDNLQDYEGCVSELSEHSSYRTLGINYDSALIMHAMSEFCWDTDWNFQVSSYSEDNIDTVDRKSPRSPSIRRYPRIRNGTDLLAILRRFLRSKLPP